MVVYGLAFALTYPSAALHADIPTEALSSALDNTGTLDYATSHTGAVFNPFLSVTCGIALYQQFLGGYQ